MRYVWWIFDKKIIWKSIWIMYMLVTETLKLYFFSVNIQYLRLNVHFNSCTQTIDFNINKNNFAILAKHSWLFLSSFIYLKLKLQTFCSILSFMKNTNPSSFSFRLYLTLKRCFWYPTCEPTLAKNHINVHSILGSGGPQLSILQNNLEVGFGIKRQCCRLRLVEFIFEISFGPNRQLIK